MIDGDNVRFQGQNVRLLGYDAPEVDERAECLSEDFLASVARATLRVLVEGNETILCLTGSTCGFERPCGFLAVQRSDRWLDVGAILMTPTDRYGVLAVPYVGEQGDWCE